VGYKSQFCTKIFLKLQLFDNKEESPLNVQVYISFLKLKMASNIKIYENKFVEYIVLQEIKRSLLHSFIEC